MFGDRSVDSVQVKICGITNLADALAAAECGANALGFNFYAGSKRYIDRLSAAQWLEQVPPTVYRVAVLVNPTLEEAIQISRLGFIDALQLHGQESADLCGELKSKGIRFAKALPADDTASLRDAELYHTNSIVLDTAEAHGFGGSGRPFRWDWASEFCAAHPGLNVLLAGGLTPQNVAEAIGRVRPFGVDVASGVERAPGRKDEARMRGFIDAVRACKV